MADDTSAPDVRFKDLCLDASDPHELAAFWTRMLHRDLVDTNDGGWRVLPDGPEATGIWVDPVPEPRTVKTRVHLDLRLPSDDVAPLLEAGAVLVHDRTDDQRWWVLADPEGNRLHAMPPPPPELHIPPVGTTTPFELVVEAADPQAQAQWWAERSGGRARTRPGATFWWVDGAAGFPLMFWMFVPQRAAKTAKNRMHWDVVLLDGSPQPLLDAGATLLRPPDGEIDWWVLADPEGNEFCAFRTEA